MQYRAVRAVQCDQTCSEGQAGVCNEESKVGRMAAGCYFDCHGSARVVSSVQVVPTPRGRDNPVSTAQSISDFRDLCGTFGTRYETQRDLIGYDQNVGPELLDQQYHLILRVQP